MLFHLFNRFRNVITISCFINTPKKTHYMYIFPFSAALYCHTYFLLHVIYLITLATGYFADFMLLLYCIKHQVDLFCLFRRSFSHVLLIIQLNLANTLHKYNLQLRKIRINQCNKQQQYHELHILLYATTFYVYILKYI